jgi:predicted RNase H-like HicB family nuclease
MSTTVVEAVFTRDADGTWLVDMPGLVGCHTFGATLDDARNHARDAVRLWLESSDFELSEVVDAEHSA